MYKKLILVFMIILLLLPTTAFAQEDTPRTFSHSVVGKMVVDCDTLSGKALKYAQKMGICSEVTTLGSGENTGDCGTVRLTINDTPSQGDAQFIVEVWSSIGPMTAISYSVPWTNLRTERGNTIFGGASVYFGTYYSSTNIVFTGSGLVTGVLDGWAQVDLLLRCYFIPTAASETIY